MEKEPIAVKAIEIKGLRRYPQSLVQQELGRVRTAQTFGALLEEIDAATQNLNQTDLFDDVRMSIGGGDAQGGAPEHVQVARQGLRQRAAREAPRRVRLLHLGGPEGVPSSDEE